MEAVHNLAVTREPVAPQHTYYRNPRQGDVSAILTSLLADGQFEVGYFLSRDGMK